MQDITQCCTVYSVKRHGHEMVLLLNRKWTQLTSSNFVHEKIVIVRCKIERDYLTVITSFDQQQIMVEDSELFMNNYRKRWINIRSRITLLNVAKHLNDGMWNQTLLQVLGTQWETHLNQNRELFKDFKCTII